MKQINIRDVQQCIEAPILYMITTHRYPQGSLLRLKDKSACVYRYDVYVLVAFQNNVLVTYSDGHIYILEDKKDHFILYNESWKPTNIVLQVL